MKIRLLDDDTINKIAAGEVIERPASVVKELVENSIDAGASRILIEVLDGGKELIRVTDDGCGMDREDAALAFQRHSTSKISSADDLFGIKTLGFRGEALSSIASVSDLVEVFTKTRTDETGTYLRIEKGAAVELKDSGSPVGTSIVVRGLFKNVPARLKHLGTASSELARITELLTQMAIINYRISFELFTGRRTIFMSSRSESWDDVLLRIYGLKVVKGLIPLQAEAEGCAVKGVIGSHLISRAGPDWIYIFVNGRPVISRAILSALREAYGTLLPSGRNPVAVISVSIDPAMVDVNVHPAKREVRFLREEAVTGLLRDAVIKTLASQVYVPRAELRDERAEFPEHNIVADQRTLPMEPEADGSADARTGEVHIADAMGEGASSKRSLRIIGQALDLYILAEDMDGLVLVDQHAAAERIRYESLLRRYASGSISQELIEPVNVELSPSEAVMMDSWRPLLQEMGFEISPFGGRTYSVRSVPMTGYRLDSPEAVRDVLRDIFASGKPGPQATIRDAVLKLLACRGSIKSGHRLSTEEMRALLADLMKCENPRTCPHGRPTLIGISAAHLERMFGRR